MNPLSAIIIFSGILFSLNSSGAEAIVIGSKIFTEGCILGEIAAQTIESSSSIPVSRKLGLGSTGILFEAIKSGAIDVYPDYTGTIAEAILKNPRLKSNEEIREALMPLGLTISSTLGFNNTYALAVKEDFAKKHNLNKISDLVQLKSKIRAAFSYEFMDRKDGYRGLIEHYRLQLDPQKVKRMEHSLVYQALSENAIDLIETYSTDANIKKYNLRVLKDDRLYFPIYEAVWVARNLFVKNHPNEWNALLKLNGSINETMMIDMNADADIGKKSFRKIASRFLGSETLDVESPLDAIALRTCEHLWLIGISLLFSILIGIPLGIISVRFYFAGQAILLLSALLQTIPSLALLCFLIPIFGIGTKPALAALCLYSLLPVVLNTFTGIRSIDSKYIENARAFGLSNSQVLFRIIMPLASPTILAGLKTATIVSIGTATLAALVGAGGYGVLIVSGLALNDIPMILTGAIPAAAMALLAHIVFELLGILIIPSGLRKKGIA